MPGKFEIDPNYNQVEDARNEVEGYRADADNQFERMV